MIIYISGPITNNPNFEHDFAKAEQHLLKLFSNDKSLTIINPVRFSKAVVGKPLSYENYLVIDTKLVSLCSHIFFLKNWKESFGCQIEYLTALQHKLTKTLKKVITPENPTLQLTLMLKSMIQS